MNPTAPATPSQLRHEAECLCAAYDQSAAILAAADQADLADETKLATLREKLRQHEAACDPDKLQDFQLTAAFKAQLAAMEAKVASDKIARRSEAERRASAAIQHVEIPKFFQRAFAAERERVVAALVPFMETEARAALAMGALDSIRSSEHWAYMISHNTPGPAVVQRLRRWLTGEVSALWRI